MGKDSFIVGLSASQVMNKVKYEENAHLVYDEYNDIGNGRCCGALIFEKYFMRVKNSAALVVLVDNLKGETKVTTIFAGNSEGNLLNFDWGAADNFASSIKDRLKDYIVREI